MVMDRQEERWNMQFLCAAYNIAYIVAETYFRRVKTDFFGFKADMLS